MSETFEQWWEQYNFDLRLTNRIEFKKNGCETAWSHQQKKIDAREAEVSALQADLTKAQARIAELERNLNGEPICLYPECEKETDLSGVYCVQHSAEIQEKEKAQRAEELVTTVSLTPSAHSGGNREADRRSR